MARDIYRSKILKTSWWLGLFLSRVSGRVWVGANPNRRGESPNCWYAFHFKVIIDQELVKGP